MRLLYPPGTWGYTIHRLVTCNLLVILIQLLFKELLKLKTCFLEFLVSPRSDGPAQKTSIIWPYSMILPSTTQLQTSSFAHLGIFQPLLSPSPSLLFPRTKLNKKIFLNSITIRTEKFWLLFGKTLSTRFQRNQIIQRLE